jgi:hypothetical protein
VDKYEEYLLPSKWQAGTGSKHIWIDLGGRWILWPMPAFYGTLRKSSGTTKDNAWYHGRLASETKLRMKHSILGAVCFSLL